ncbi:MAG: hypothetical protein JJD98_07160 [Polaromonas sp.]|nr:hypothetical protein [Polaromonas sp.]
MSRINKVTVFPQIALDRRDALQVKTLVSFCTGGVRCEKNRNFHAENCCNEYLPYADAGRPDAAQ